MAMRGSAALDVELNAQWSWEDLRAKLARTFPDLFRYLSRHALSADGLPPVALCYQDNNLLKIYEKPKFTGADMFKVKTNQPPLEGLIYLGKLASIVNGFGH